MATATKKTAAKKTTTNEEPEQPNPWQQFATDLLKDLNTALQQDPEEQGPYLAGIHTAYTSRQQHLTQHPHHNPTATPSTAT